MQACKEPRNRGLCPGIGNRKVEGCQTSLLQNHLGRWIKNVFGSGTLLVISLPKKKENTTTAVALSWVQRTTTVKPLIMIPKTSNATFVTATCATDPAKTSLSSWRWLSLSCFLCGFSSCVNCCLILDQFRCQSCCFIVSSCCDFEC